MPKVLFEYDPIEVGDSTLDRVLGVLQGLVAYTLNCKEIPTTAEQVSVKVSEMGERDKMNNDISILIHAVECPERKADNEKNHDGLKTAIAALLPVGMTLNLWIILHPVSAFGTAVGTGNYDPDPRLICNECDLGRHGSCVAREKIGYCRCTCLSKRKQPADICAACRLGRHIVCEHRLGDVPCKCPRCYPAPPEEPVVCDYCNVGRHDECERLKGDPCHCPRCWAEPVVCEYCMTGRHDDCERLRDVGKCNCAECWPSALTAHGISVYQPTVTDECRQGDHPRCHLRGPVRIGQTVTCSCSCHDSQR